MQNNIKEEFYQALSDQIDHVGRRKEIVLFLDFNAWTGKKLFNEDFRQDGELMTGLMTLGQI